MKKLLYITANPKPEEISTSKTVGREFINRFLGKNSDYTVEELDLYNEFIPEMNYKIFTARAELVSGDQYKALTFEEKRAVDRINALCDQFVSADTYVIAAPVWSLNCPPKLKQYVDCIDLNNRTIQITPDEVKGLLDDKERSMVYIQSCGGVYPRIFGKKFNHGITYFHDLFKFLGIANFEKILVQGVDEPSIGKDKAISTAYDDIDDVIDKLSSGMLAGV